MTIYSNYSILQPRGEAHKSRPEAGAKRADFPAIPLLIFEGRYYIMDIQTIGQLVASLGFPIVAAAALFWYMNKQRESHEAETKAMRDSLNENTKVLSELKELIKYLVSDLKGDKNG